MDKSYKKINHFYIDESGSILNDSKVFILGCIKTDTPVSLNTTLENLLLKITDDIFYSATIEKILDQGFHATENHPDVRSELYRILPLLNFRSYFVILNKKTAYFNEHLYKVKEAGVYSNCLKKLLRNRIEVNSDNIFNFEVLQFESTTQHVIMGWYQ